VKQPRGAAQWQDFILNPTLPGQIQCVDEVKHSFYQGSWIEAATFPIETAMLCLGHKRGVFDLADMKTRMMCQSAVSIT
jgi:lipocalin